MSRNLQGWSLGQRSFIGRLLWPVNVISFFLLFGLCASMVVKIEGSVAEALNSKAEGAAAFLQAVGEQRLANGLDGDKSAIEAILANVERDPDSAYAIFFDNTGRAITNERSRSLVAESKSILTVERLVSDSKGAQIASVTVGYKADRIQSAFWSAARLGGLGLILTQVLLSIAIFAVSRSIISPFTQSLRRLSQTGGVLSKTSGDISKFSDALSSGVNHQAEVVQETTAAMTEMSSMLAQTSNYSKQSETIMSSVTAKANNGMAIMNQMVEAMSSVQQANDQLQQMAEIIQEIASKTNVINEIVFKTQLLSFNASIEAARAGQHGRGFAVVAEEVGNLAKMSGTAAQEIANLLNTSEKQVTEIVRSTHERVSIGKSVTEQALVKFKEIAADINMVSVQIANISAAAREQELGVAQTNQAMSELNKTTELNNQIANSASETSQTLETAVTELHSISHAIELSLSGHTKEDVILKSASTPAKTKNLIPFSPLKAHDKYKAEAELHAQQHVSSLGSPHDVDALSEKILELATKTRSETTSTSDSKKNVG